MQIVAEGLETEIAAATLVALGGTRAQGFLFAKPCPAWEMISARPRNSEVWRESAGGR